MDRESVVDVLNAALKIEKLYYDIQGSEDWPDDFKHAMFKMRKALEGIYGHELPQTHRED